MTTVLQITGIEFPNLTTWDSGEEIDRIVSNCTYDTAAVLTKSGKIMVWTSGNTNNADGVGHTANTRHPPMAIPFPDSETGYIVDAEIRQVVGWALFSTGNLYTWGSNTDGACGAGATSLVRFPYLAATSVAEVYKQIGGGYAQAHTDLHIRKTDNTYWCTGYNGHGRLGLGDATVRNVFTQMTGLTAGTVRKMWPMGGSNYGVLFLQKTDGTIWGCGYNVSGMLGLGNATQQNTLVDITTAWGGNATDIVSMAGNGVYGTGAAPSAGGTICMVRADGSVRTSGNGASGQIGDGTLVSKTTPQLIIAAGSGAVEVCSDSGGTALTFYLRYSNGTLKSWGYNGQGQCGNGTTTAVSTPYTLSTTCAKILTKQCGNDQYSYMNSFIWVENDGTVKGCGVNQYAQLACANPVFDTAQKSTPVQCPHLIGVTELTCNGYGQGEWYMGIKESKRITNGVTYIKRDLVMWGYNGRYNIEPYQAASPIHIPITRFFN